MPELSVIIPFVNDWPHIMWTVRAVSEELRGGGIDFEIIAVNNYVPGDTQHMKGKEDNGASYLRNMLDDPLNETPWLREMFLSDTNLHAPSLSDETTPEDHGKKYLAAMRGNKWLKVIDYKEKASHWNAKRIGIDASSAPILFFCDSHCFPANDALVRMFNLYRDSHKALLGTIHMPTTYELLEWRRTIYKLIVDRQYNKVTYSLTGYKGAEHPYEVPCMSTCGMMITRKLYDSTGGWPKLMGTYSGGEQFLNFTMAVMGLRHWIMPGGPIYHHSGRPEGRGYAYDYASFLVGHIAASYIYGGEEWVRGMVKHVKGHQSVVQRMLKVVLAECKQQRELVKSQQVMHISEWLERWGK